MACSSRPPGSSGGPGPSRTVTSLSELRILSPVRLPVPPRGPGANCVVDRLASRLRPRCLQNPGVWRAPGASLGWPRSQGEDRMADLNLGWFEVSLDVKDIKRSLAFYQALGFQIVDGSIEKRNVTLQKADCRIALYQG